MHSPIYRIDLSVIADHLYTLSHVLGVKQLHFNCDFDVTDTNCVSEINEFRLFEDEVKLTDFEHALLAPDSAYTINEDLVNMVCENLLYYTAACLDNELYRLFAEGVIDFDNNEIAITSCYGSEYVNRVEEFTLSERTRVRYTPHISTIYLDHELHAAAKAIASKTNTNSNITIETIKI